ncbi:MAG: 2TM domain-containing protein [Acidimicrobiales bacterium]
MSGADERGVRPWSALAIHATVYVAVNALLIASWVLFGGGSASQLGSVLTSLDAARVQGFWPMYVMVFWGAALLIHLGWWWRLPGRRRRRRACRRQARRRAELQASVVGALPDGVLTDAAVAGIRLTDGEKAARKVQRAAARQGGSSRPTAGTASGGGRVGTARVEAMPRGPRRAEPPAAARRTAPGRTASGRSCAAGDRRHRAGDRRHRGDDRHEGRPQPSRSAAARPRCAGRPDRAPGDPPATGAWAGPSPVGRRPLHRHRRLHAAQRGARGRHLGGRAGRSPGAGP